MKIEKVYKISPIFQGLVKIIQRRIKYMYKKMKIQRSINKRWNVNKERERQRERERKKERWKLEKVYKLTHIFKECRR